MHTINIVGCTLNSNEFFSRILHDWLKIMSNGNIMTLSNGFDLIHNVMVWPPNLHIGLIRYLTI